MTAGDHSLRAASSRTTGISSATINNGAGSLGSEIDNTTNLDDAINVEIVATHGTTPTACAPWFIYVLYAIDGTNYEDGGSSTQPARPPDGVALVRATTSAQRIICQAPVRLKAHKCKILAWNAVGQNATSVTVTAYSHNDKVATS